MTPPTVLFISPDYASHFYPLSAIAEACAGAGMRVVFATGPGMEPSVHRLGFEYTRLVLGPGQNSGLLRVDRQPDEERSHMQAFFDATVAGPVEALIYQTRQRRHDMLHTPADIYRRVAEILKAVHPDHTVVDQLSYGATLALHALGVPFISFHPSNPTGLPGEGELFGLPAHMPAVLQVDATEFARLRTLCEDTTASFTETFNAVVAKVAPNAYPVRDAFAFTSPWLVLVNYPEGLATERRARLPVQARFIGSCVRRESEDPFFTARLERLLPDRQTVYLSFGTFLSAREDVMLRVVTALSSLPVNVILASGVATTNAWESLPDNWIVQPVVPQIAALRCSDLAITHGGNNTITEALTLGVPLLVGPFSSDQFDNAADVERAGVGEVFAPNTATPPELSAQTMRMLGAEDVHQRAASLGAHLRAHPGPELAARMIAAS